jgi:hypothetical protein
MAVENNTYVLPDEMLNLIASAPELNFSMPQQTSSAQFATPGVRRSDLISALRNTPGAANTGFTQYANPTNGMALQPTSRKAAGEANNPTRLAMQKYDGPVPVFVPDADLQPPQIRPEDPVLPNLPDVLEPEILEPKVVEPELSIYTDPIISDIPDEIRPEDIPQIIPTEPIDLPDLPEQKELEDKSFWDDSGDPSIYTDPIVSDIPDEAVKPEDIPLITPADPIELPELPEVKEPEDKSFWDDAGDPSIYTDPIISDIPDVIQPEDIPLITPSEPIELPELPDVADPEPYVPEPAPYVPEPEPYIPEPEFYFPELEPYVPEPEPLPEDEEAIDAWLMDQFGGGGLGGGGMGGGGSVSLDDYFDFMSA